jgi:excisionase family DNA binding protein
MQTQNRKKKNSRFLTLAEVQSILNIKSRKTILKFIAAGSLSAYKLGGTRWRIAARDVEQFLADHQVGNGKRS